MRGVDEHALALEAVPFEAVALAASAGGLHAVSEVVGALPADLPLAVVLVQHLDPRHRSFMVDILARRTDLAVRQAADGIAVESGILYIAPPDNHLLVTPERTLVLSQTAPVNFVRPSADLLFESMAAAYGVQLIAVVLSGSGRDGSAGVKAVSALGGTVIAQDEDDAEFAGMPHAAIRTGTVDYTLPLAAIGPALTALALGERAVGPSPKPPDAREDRAW